LKKWLFNKGLASKQNNLETKGSTNHCFYDKLLFNKMRQLLGGRVRLMLTGSAPLSAEVQEFMKIAFCCPLVEGYG